MIRPLQDAEYFEAKQSRRGGGGNGAFGNGGGGGGRRQQQQQPVNELDDGTITDAQIAELAGGPGRVNMCVFTKVQTSAIAKSENLPLRRRWRPEGVPP